MTMPAGQPPAAMPGMPAISPEADHKTGRTAAPSSAPPRAARPSGAPEPGGAAMTMPKGGKPMPVPQALPESGGMSMPQPLPPGTMPDMTEQRTSPGPLPGNMPMSGEPGSAAMPGAKAKVMSPPVTGVPGIGPSSPSFPGRNGVPGPITQEAAPPARGKPGEITPPAPSTLTPGTNPRDPRYRPPVGGEPQPGVSEPAAVSRSKGGGVIPPGATALPGGGRDPLIVPSPGGDVPPRPMGPAPAPGTKGGEESSLVPGAPEVNR